MIAGLRIPVGVAVFAFLALAGLMGVFAFNAAPPAQAQGQCQKDGNTYKCNYPENSTRSVITFGARSDDGRTITSWSHAGEDAEHFDLTAGQLSFREPPDYETQADGDPDASPSTRDGVYKVDVRSTDEDRNVGEVKVEVTVTNVDEIGKVEMSVRQPQVERVFTATLTDPDDPDNEHRATDTWQWSKSRTKSGSYSNIDNATEATYTPKPGDASYFLRATVMYTDGHGSGKSQSGESDYAVDPKPTSQNSPPSFAADQDPDTTGVQADAPRSVKENTPKGRAIGNPLVAGDVDKDVLTYTLGGTDADSFDIDWDTGQLRVKAKLNFADDTDTAATDDVEGSATVVVTATDPSGESDDVTVNITVTDVNEAPKITGGLLTGTAKVLYVGEGATATFSDMGLSVASTVYTAADEDDGRDTAGAITLGGPDKDKFDIGGGTLAFNTADAPQFEDPKDANKDNTYEVTLRSTSTPTARALRGTLDVKVIVVNADDTGEITFDRPTLRVGTPVQAMLKDADVVKSISGWQWYQGTDTTTPITGATSDTYTPVHADIAAGPELHAVAMYIDRQDDTTTRTLGGTTTAVQPWSPNNEPPKFKDEDTDTDGVQAKRKVAENTEAYKDDDEAEAAAAGDTPDDPRDNVGTRVAASDDLEDNLIYSLEGQDADKFRIRQEDTTSDAMEGGQIEVAGDTELDYETQKTYMVTVKAEDSFGDASTIDVTITVTDDPNEAPTIAPVSTDATLMALSLSEGTLTPAFMADTMAYTAMVEHSVDSVTVMATASDAGATPVIMPVDADAEMDGHQVSLAEGANTITVTVTAEDGTTTETYTITVTRAGPGLPAVVVKYDDPANGGNDNGMVDITEIINAINDYKASRNDTTIAEILELIRIYKSQA